MMALTHDQVLDAPQFFTTDHMSSSTSPSPPQTNGAGHVTGAARRPPRKSTLTQQQKNQKRQRATQDQLITLEVEFNKNPTPSAVVRERIAQEINMTERSVQIWFQNRRAKIKLLAKKSIEAGEDCDDIPESVRIYLANQNPELRALTRMGPGGNRLSGYGPEGLLAPEHATPGKIVIQHFTCRSLSIGSWRRVGQNAMDLVIFYSPEKAIITYYINNDSAGYKIEFPFAYIKSIELETLNVPVTHQSPHGSPMQGQLVITLLRPPHFFMDTSGSGGFVQCGDFTEDQQATQIMTHRLGGNPKSLQSQLAKLLNLEVFQNRHNIQQAMFENPALSMSAPVSPHPPARPSSASGMGPPSAFMQKEVPRQPFAGMRGHRRQRSRSVPIAIDFSQLHQPMPSFNFEEALSEGESESRELCAPSPQHPHALSNNLRIDTSAPGFLDYRPAYPLSAATTASVSEYATSPGLMGGMPGDAGMPSPYGNIPWLSPMMDQHNQLPQSVSPMSTLGQGGDPIIASGSPPLMDRSGSAELFPLTHPDPNSLGEDGLSELYAKQTIMMPMHHTPSMEDLDEMEAHLSLNMSPMPTMSLSPEGNPA